MSTRSRGRGPSSRAVRGRSQADSGSDVDGDASAPPVGDESVAAEAEVPVARRNSVSEGDRELALMSRIESLVGTMLQQHTSTTRQYIQQVMADMKQPPAPSAPVPVPIPSVGVSVSGVEEAAVEVRAAASDRRTGSAREDAPRAQVTNGDADEEAARMESKYEKDGKEQSDPNSSRIPLWKTTSTIPFILVCVHSRTGMIMIKSPTDWAAVAYKPTDRQPT